MHKSLRRARKLLKLIRDDIVIRRRVPVADPNALDFYVDIQQIRYDRYFFKLLWTLTRNNSIVGLHPRQGLAHAMRDWRHSDIYGPLAICIPGIQWAVEIPQVKQDKIFVCDNEQHPLIDKDWKSVYIIDPRIDRAPPIDQPWLMLPFLMHPRMYLDNCYSEAPKFRDTTSADYSQRGK